LGSDDTTSETPAGQTPAAGSGDSNVTDLGADDEASAELNPDDTPKAKEEAKPSPYFGLPENGEYGEFTLPDGAEADPALRDEFLPIVKELQLNQEGAQKLVDFKAKLDQHAIENWGNHVNDLRTQAQADPEIGGAKYQPSLIAGKAAIKQFGTPAFRQMLNHYGVGNHPEMIRFLAKVGAATSETTIPPGGGATTVADKPLHDLMYKD
jgi:hypothetical protein